MAVHQCAGFNAYPMLCHEKAVKRSVRYPLGSSDKQIAYKPDSTHGLDVFVDADFAGGWSSGNVHNPEVVLSRTGYVIMYAGCPVTWSSKLQTEIAFSTTKAEYIAGKLFRSLTSCKKLVEYLSFSTQRLTFIAMFYDFHKDFCLLNLVAST